MKKNDKVAEYSSRFVGIVYDLRDLEKKLNDSGKNSKLFMIIL